MGLPPRCEPLLRDGLFRLVHGLRDPRLEAGGGLPVEDALADGDVELGDGVRKEAADLFGLGLRRPAEILHDVADLGDDGAVAGPAAVALRGALLGLLGVRHVGSVTPFSGCSSAGGAAGTGARPAPPAPGAAPEAGGACGAEEGAGGTTTVPAGACP